MIEKYFLKDELVFREEEEGGFLFDPFTGSLKCLNKTAAFILRAIETEGKKKSEILKLLLDEFDIENKKTLETDLNNFLIRLKSLNYLKEIKKTV